MSAINFALEPNVALLPVLQQFQDQLLQQPLHSQYPEARFLLGEHDGILWFGPCQNHCISAIHLMNDWRQRLSTLRGKQEFLSKALSLSKRSTPPKVLDTTAGLGRDGVVMSALGADVLMVERELPLACLLKQALSMAAQTSWGEHCGSIEVIHAEAADALKRYASNTFDSFYYDPMFSHKSNKSALNKRSIHLLQDYCGHQKSGDQQLFDTLIQKLEPGQRMIIKRPKHEPPCGQYLNFQLMGKSFRFDIHLRPLQH